MGAKRTGNPFHHAALFYNGALGVQVVHVLGPVLNGGIPQLGVLAHKQLHAAGVQVGHIVLGGRAALDEMQRSTLVHNNQRVLKLASAGGVQAEIGLQGNLHMHMRRNIHKRTARPYRAVQGGKFVIRGGNQVHEMGTDHLGIRAVHGAFQVGVNNTLLRNLFFHVVIYQLGVILCADTGQAVALGLGDTQLFKGILDVGGHFAPLGAHFGVGAHIGDDIIHVQLINRRAPLRDTGLIIDLQRFQAQLQHPVGVVLLAGNLLYNGGGQASVYLVGVFFLIAEIIQAAVNVLNLRFFAFCFVYFCHIFLRPPPSFQSARSRSH